MKRSSIKLATICALLVTAMLLSSCALIGKSNGTDGSDLPNDSANGETDSGIVELFCSDTDYVILKTTVEGNFSSKVQDFLFELREKVGKSDIFAGTDYSKAVGKEILIGYIPAREESVAKCGELSLDAYYVGFFGEKLLISAYTAEAMESALDCFLDALEKTDSGAWGVPAELSIYRANDGKDIRVPELSSASGRLVGAYISNEDRCQLAYKNVTADEFTSYGETLTAAGYRLYSQNSIGDNRYATYVSDTTEVHIIYYPTLSNFRIVFGTLGYLPPTQTPEYEKVSDCKVTQIGRYGASALAAGESYIIQLEDGSFIVIDGGPNNAQDLEGLIAFMRENKPESHVKPRVTWMFTHLHGDHTTLAISFLSSKASDIELQTICYNFPNVNSALNDTDCATLYSSILGLKWKYPNAKTYVFHSGQKMYLAGCEIEFLYTQEDHWPTGFNTANDTSAVWRMTFEGGDFLVLGDSESTPCKQIAKIYGDYLESDILQLSHHGMNGATTEIYEAIDPKICFWAIDEERFLTDERCLGNKAGFEFNAYIRGTEWTRNGESGERLHYSASRTVTVNMSDMTVSVGELLK